MDMLLKDVPFKDMGLWQFDFRADEDVVWVAEIVVSDDGNVEKGIKYVNQNDYDSFEKAILRAENVFNRYLSNEVIDFNLYLLYFANAGSNNDIGAKFAGFNYEGFDNQIKVN